MNWKTFLKDKQFFLVLFLILNILFLFLLRAFHVYKELIYAIFFLLNSFFFLSLTYDYYRKKYFYQQLFFQIKELDQSYLVLEVLQKPNFLEGKLLDQALYEINKSMIENIKKYEHQTKEFQEYIEMWIHEMKIPLATLELLNHNQKEQIHKKIKDQITKLEDNIEQVLYYTRQEFAENDYLIRENNLEQIVNAVALKNKDSLLENKVDFIVKNVNVKINTDSKWLLFILNQIINNSIKYRKKKHAQISISIEQEKNYICLIILDNGIGIPKQDLTRVFQKTFTGSNGRVRGQSTGMGLYIANQLCNKLGHQLKISSIEKQFTEVRIYFSQNQYYDVIK